MTGEIYLYISIYITGVVAHYAIAILLSPKIKSHLIKYYETSNK